MEYKRKYVCELCGRNTFDNPSPHRCRGGFRKRGLTWRIIYVPLSSLNLKNLCNK